MAFLEAGIHVICDKPLALNLQGGEGAARSCWRRRPDVIFALTHNYSGYPMIRQAKAMVAAGELGEIRVVQGEYPQDWLTEPHREDRPEAGRLAHRPEAVRRRRLRSATSAPMPISSLLRCLRPEARGALRPISRPS